MQRLVVIFQCIEKYPINSYTWRTQQIRLDYSFEKNLINILDFESFSFLFFSFFFFFFFFFWGGGVGGFFFFSVFFFFFFFFFFWWGGGGERGALISIESTHL